MDTKSKLALHALWADVFVGQIDIPVGLFHDDASFYTFYESRIGTVRTIVQVA
jgi:RNAse (barnase) inhibitor barstar